MVKSASVRRSEGGVESAVTPTSMICPMTLEIGPITADTLREYGLTPHIVAEEHTIPGLVAALEKYHA